MTNWQIAFRVFTVTLVCFGICIATLQASQTQYLSNTSYQTVPEQEQLIQAPEQRTVLDLGGTWLVGPPGAQPDGEIWIPGCYPDEEVRDFHRTFTLGPDFTGKHISLIAEGINYRATVRVNGRIIGTHIGGYTRCVFPIPEEVLHRETANTLTITVDNHLSADRSIPTRHRIWSWKNYGGIYREIYLLGVPPVTIENMVVTTTFDTGYTAAYLNIVLQVRNHQALQNVAGASSTSIRENIVEVGFGAELRDLSSGVVVARYHQVDPAVRLHHSGTLTIPLEVTAPTLWSPESPHRYQLRAFLYEANVTVDIVEQMIGLRDIGLSEGNIFLNGQRVRLNAVLYHEDAPDRGAAMDWSTLEADIVKMKTLGINAVQTGLYPCHPYLYTLCDVYGLLVLEGLPVWNVPPEFLGRAEYQELAKISATEMILRDRHHPSIVAWGLGYELDAGHAATGVYLQELARHIRILDGRPVFLTVRATAAMPDLPDVDILAPVLPPGTPAQHAEALRQWMTRYPEKPILLGRYGSDVFPENFDGGYNDKTSLEHQGKYLRDMVTALTSLEALDGSVLWSYADWRGNRPLLTNGPDVDPYLYTMGLLDYQRHNRVGYVVMQSLLAGHELPALYAGADDEDGPLAFRLTGIVVLVLLTLSIRWQRRFGANLKRSLVFTQGFFDDVARRRNVPKIQTMILASMLAAMNGAMLGSFLFHYRRDFVFDSYLDALITSATVKEFITWIAWEPVAGILTGAGATIIGLYALAGLLLAVSTICGRRVTGLYTFQVVVWSGTVLLPLLPVAMTLNTVLLYAYAPLAIAGALSLFLVWYGARIINALSVATRASRMRLGLELGTVAVTLMLLAGYYFQHHYGTWQYLQALDRTVHF